jgi:ligand-binding sensor domain-containing protein
MIIDKKDNLWIGTDKWIAIYLPETETFKTYDKSIGLINDAINSIFVRWKEIWLGTSGGIAKWVLKE